MILNYQKRSGDGDGLGTRGVGGSPAQRRLWSYNLRAWDSGGAEGKAHGAAGRRGWEASSSGAAAREMMRAPGRGTELKG